MEMYWWMWLMLGVVIGYGGPWVWKKVMAE